MSHISRLLHALRYRWYLVVLAGVDLVVFFEIDPRKVPSWVLMLGFLLLVTTVYALIGCAVDMAAGLSSGVKLRKKKIKASLGLVSLFLLGLQSIGQLTTKDFVALIPLLLVGYFYLSYPGHKDRAHDNR